MLPISISAELNKIIKKILEESEFPEMQLTGLPITYSGKLYPG